MIDFYSNIFTKTHLHKQERVPSVTLRMLKTTSPSEYLIRGGVTLQNALANNDEDCK